MSIALEFTIVCEECDHELSAYINRGNHVVIEFCKHCRDELHDEIDNLQSQIDDLEAAKK